MALEAGDASVNRPAYILTQGGRCRTVGVVDAKANKQSGTESAGMLGRCCQWGHEDRPWTLERVREKSAQSEQANHPAKPEGRCVAERGLS